MTRTLSALILSILVLACDGRKEIQRPTGFTEITKWKGGKDGAVSITYDDATINQFRQAIPIMDTLGFKGTFFINTADLSGSTFAPKFIGRPIGKVIAETAIKITDSTNLFERASAVRFLDIPNAVDIHNQIGSLYETGKADEAYRETDQAFAAVRKKRSTREVRPVLLTGELITWEELRQFARHGHEFGNHTISHPRLAVLDEPNLLYELEKCKEEIRHQLGSEQIFSCECPFGTENERVMNYAYAIHPALRNRMPAPFLKEINRGSKESPVDTAKEYVQWQRGPLKKTSVNEMTAWIDTLIQHNNIWLVLTFHGIDSVGWEAKPHQQLKEYFMYMKKNEDKLWVATFRDVAKYMRERMSATLDTHNESNKIIITVKQSLDTTLYNIPLTLRTIVKPEWDVVVVRQGNTVQKIRSNKNDIESFVLYDIFPNGVPVELTKE